MEDDYRRFTLNWAMLGLCVILVLNFILPILVGSISAIWFYLSTLLGTIIVVMIKRFAERQFRASLTAIDPNLIVRLAPSKQRLGRIQPTLLIGLIMIMLYQRNIIPPVPLVKRDMQVGIDLRRIQSSPYQTTYQITQQKAPWWQFWHKTINSVVMNDHQKVYCLSVIFAPAGLSVRLIHQWEYQTSQGWTLISTQSFALNGGRSQGFRGYTTKQNLKAGHWRVLVKTETQQTVARYEFNVEPFDIKNAKNTIVQSY